MASPGGRIIRIEELDGMRLADVEVADGLACPRCAAGKGCGAGLSARDGRRSVTARVDPGLQVNVGDAVRIELEPRDLLLAAWLVYGLPLVAAVLAATLAYLAGLGDAPAALAALAGLVAGVVYSRSRLGKGTCLRRFTPRIVANTPVAR